MTAKKSSQKQNASPPAYRLNKKGKIVGPNGRDIASSDSDTPIVISGGSLQIISGAELEDDDHPGQRTKQLHAQEMAKHVTSIQLIGFKPDPANPNRLVPSNSAKPVCHIIIHYG